MVQEEIYSYLLYSKNTPFHLTKKKKKKLVMAIKSMHQSVFRQVHKHYHQTNLFASTNTLAHNTHPKKNQKKEKRRKKIRVVQYRLWYGRVGQRALPAKRSSSDFSSHKHHSIYQSLRIQLSINPPNKGDHPKKKVRSIWIKSQPTLINPRSQGLF